MQIASRTAIDKIKVMTTTSLVLLARIDASVSLPVAAAATDSSRIKRMSYMKKGNCNIGLVTVDALSD
jgi:hypothetical protein